jgi:ABC-2 type transport system permease protein
MSARKDPLLPNAAIVARREYRDRIRSPFFVVSTILLMALALGVALAPVFIRYLDSRTVARVVVISSDGELGSRAVATADSLLNIPPGGIDPADWKKPYRVESGIDETAANELLARGEIRGILVVERLASGQLDVVFRTDRPTDVQSRQTMGLVGIVLGVYDWTSNLPDDVSIGAYQPPAFQVDAVGAPTEDGRPIDAQQIASRGFLGVVFVVLLFLTVIIYGMWVATGVAAEKSSRVMELMISAASPRQLLTGKVVGIGGAGLTQYVAIAVPALVVVGLQDRIAIALMGPAGAAAAPIAGLTPGLLLGYGVFFLLGFALFALIYAAMGSFVSRPDDLQTLSLPLSLLAMGGYLAAVLTLSSGGGGALTRLLSFVPPFSPFVMLARLMVGAVTAVELVASVAILLATIAFVAFAAARMYEAGVLLYGQRPGLRAFIAAARRAG